MYQCIDRIFELSVFRGLTERPERHRLRTIRSSWRHPGHSDANPEVCSGFPTMTDDRKKLTSTENFGKKRPSFGHHFLSRFHGAEERQKVAKFWSRQLWWADSFLGYQTNSSSSRSGHIARRKARQHRSSSYAEHQSSLLDSLRRRFVCLFINQGVDGLRNPCKLAYEQRCISIPEDFLRGIALSNTDGVRRIESIIRDPCRNWFSKSQSRSSD